MNFSEIIENIKYNRKWQIGVLIFLFLFFVFIIRPIFFGSKKLGKPCYQVTLRVWSPFKEENFYPLIDDLGRYCIYFKFEKKSLEDIKENLIYSLATENFPDIVYVDDSYLFKYQNLLATPTPIHIDSLIAYYNKDILNFFQIEKPRTIDDLKNFIQQVRNIKKENFYPLGLGTKEIRNRKEIILTLITLNPDYNKKSIFRNNFYSILQFYHLFQDPRSEFFSYYQGLGDDLTNFAQEKLAMYIGFYKDRKEILTINPRLNYEIFFLPNTFPPKMKIYRQVFYLVPTRKSQNLKISLDVLDYFSKYKLKEFTESLDLIPAREELIDSEEKKIVFSSAKNFGESFNFFDKEVIFDNLDRIFDLWDNEKEIKLIIEQIVNSL